MDKRVVDALTRNAGASTHRRSLLMLGGAGLAAALTSPSLTMAAKKAKKRCNKEKNQCREAVQEFCEENENCLDSFLQCCDTCKVGQGVDCVLNAVD